MKQYILTLTTIFIVFVSQAQSNFSFTPTNSSAIFNGQAQINGVQLTSNDTIAAYDTSGNCCGAVALINYNGDAYINLVIYGDDATTPSIDEGINGTENFYLHLYDSSEDTILIYQSINNIVSFTGWSNTNGTPLALYSDPNIVYDFTFSIYGCTDPLAFNYDVNANTDDGSCIAVASGCTDPLAFNYDAIANTDDGSCIAVALGCTDIIACNYDSLANTDDGSCNYASSSTINTNTCDSIVWNGITYDSSGTYIVEEYTQENNFALNFTNTDNIIIPNSAELNPTEITVSFWTKVSVNDNYNHFVNKWDGTIHQYIVSSNTTGIYVYIGNNNYQTSILPQLNVWEHIAFTYSSITQQGFIYLNGSVIHTFTSNQLIPSSVPLHIGGNSIVGNIVNSVDGKIDNVQLWQTAQTQQVIQNYMNCHPVGDESGLVGYWNFEEGNGTIVYDQTSNNNNGTINGASYDVDVLSQTCNLTNISGCDSTVILNLTINNSTSNVTTVTACDSYIWLIDGNNYTSSGTYTSTSVNTTGCTHTDTLILFINDNTINSTTVTACNSYIWPIDSTFYTASGTYLNINTNSSGCDDTTILYLTINNSTSNNTTVTVCDSHVWLVDGNTYTTSGTYTNVSTNASGCTHIDTLVLTINSSTSTTTSITECDSYAWAIDSNTYTASGIYTSTSINAVGCTHIDTLILTINNSTSNVTTLTACDSYIWPIDSTIYTTSGTYTNVSTNASGCTHIDTLVLTINISTSTTMSITSCDNYTWLIDGNNYITSGTYTNVSNNASGCTHIDTLVLTINSSTSTTTSITECDSYAWAIDSNTYTASGIYTSISINAVGCTHIDTLILTINNSTSNVTTLIACDSYIWPIDSTIYTTSGIYINISTNGFGCTHIDTLVLTINSSIANTTTITTCDSYSWLVNGTTYFTSGTYININTNNFGCPDTNTLILTINNSTSNTATIIECDSYTWSVDGNTYTTSGTYTNVSTNTTGCTHIDTLVLTIYNSTSTVTTITSCDNYTWPIDSTVYTTSGIHVNISTNASGCTHIDTLVLTINSSTSTTTSITSCDSYVWTVDGNTYTTSGTYTNVSTNTAGCTYIDSLVLTINNSSSSTASIIECDSYIWPIDSTIYTVSGIYTNVSTNVAGCTHIDTLILTLNSSTSTTTIINACDSLYSWSVNGITYTSNGTYIDSSINLDGCLHTEILILTLDNSTTNTTTIVECDSYTWSVNGIVYISSGIYIDSSININGCIHVDTLDLTLDYTSIYNDNISICQGDVYTLNNSIYSTSGYYIDSILDVNCWSIINTNLTVGNTLTSSISQIGNILASNVIGGFPPYSYQWNTFDTTANITTSLNGQYWLIISDSLNCPVDTTYFYVDIHLGISDFGINELSIYPNPSNDVFNISFKSNNAQDFSVRILNVIGEKLIVEDLQQFIGEYSKKISLNQNSKGIYFLEIETKNGIINKKIILN